MYVDFPFRLRNNIQRTRILHLTTRILPTTIDVEQRLKKLKKTFLLVTTSFLAVMTLNQQQFISTNYTFQQTMNTVNGINIFILFYILTYSSVMIKDYIEFRSKKNSSNSAQCLIQMNSKSNS